MLCDDPDHLVTAYVDGELTSDKREAFESHLQGCQSCARRVEQLRTLSRAFSKIGREPMPASLPQFLKNSFPIVSDEVPSGATVVPLKPVRLSIASQGWWRMAAAIVVTCLISSFSTLWLTNGAVTRNRVADDIVSAHLRSLIQESPVQIASSDQHNVKPWFAGKVDFSPDVRDFAELGYPLVGGRLDVIDDRRVGVLVYRHGRHLINVFAFSSGGSQPARPTHTMHLGYNLLNWVHNGVAYWAISDTSEAELEQLFKLL